MKKEADVIALLQLALSLDVLEVSPLYTVLKRPEIRLRVVKTESMIEASPATSGTGARNLCSCQRCSCVRQRTRARVVCHPLGVRRPGLRMVRVRLEGVVLRRLVAAACWSGGGGARQGPPKNIELESRNSTTIGKKNCVRRGPRPAEPGCIRQNTSSSVRRTCPCCRWCCAR